MSQKAATLFLIFCLITVYRVAAGDAADNESGRRNPMTVYVSILPQAYFVERVGGEQVDVTVLVGPGQSPATFEPTPKTVAGLSEAALYFRIGVPFERRLLEKTQKLFPHLQIVDTQEGITLRSVDRGHHHRGEEHHEGAADPHTWLDPRLVKIQAQHIADALVRLDPDHAGDYERNLQAFLDDLDRLDSTIAFLLQPHQGARFFVFHPSYGYFADRYGLVQVAVETDGKEPGARQLSALIEQARTDRIRAVFVQAQYSTRTAEAIAREVGVDALTLDPLARDYIDNLGQMARKIAAAFGHIGAAPGHHAKETDHESRD